MTASQSLTPKQNAWAVQLGHTKTAMTINTHLKVVALSFNFKTSIRSNFW